MFMVCWHYCVPFLNFFLYAIGPIFILAGIYILKRGMVRYHRGIRKRGLILWAIGGAKIIVFDYRFLLQRVFCAGEDCGRISHMVIDISAIILAAGGYIFWKYLYAKFVPDGKQKTRSGIPDVKPLYFWTRWAMASVMLFVVWTAGPFATSLIFSTIPAVFLIISWHYFAIFSLFCLMAAFWQWEEFQWFFSSTKSKLPFKKNVWVPKDTLWTLAFVYVFTAMLAFASSAMIEQAANRI